MHSTPRTRGPNWRTRLAAAAAAAVVGTTGTMVAAEPARAAYPTVTLDCEWHLDWYNCSFLRSGFYQVDAIYWFVNGNPQPAYEGLNFFSRHCARAGRSELVQILVVGTENAFDVVAAAADSQRMPCNCLPGF